MAQPVYLFTRGQRGIFSEVYFPKKVAYQGTIFTALEEGHDEGVVKTYLEDNARSLLIELADYPYDLFDPYRYGTVRRPSKQESPLTKAKKRIGMYVSPFKGWSMYEVDGVFFTKERAYEELTQVVRLMFRVNVDKRYERLARKNDCRDVFRSMLLFIMRTRDHIEGETPWDTATMTRFMDIHEPWRNQRKRKFAERHFSNIAREVRKWIDDCALFTFGYIVRKFSKKVLETGRLEDEIWVTSFFDLTLNIIRRPKQSQQPQKGK